MANKVFALISTSDREVALEVGLVYPNNAAKNKWLDEVKVIFFGPSEKLLAYDTEVQAKVKDLQSNGVEVIACRACSERLKVTAQIESQGVKVIYVGQTISQLIKDGWAQLTF